MGFLSRNRGETPSASRSLRRVVTSKMGNSLSSQSFSDNDETREPHPQRAEEQSLRGVHDKLDNLGEQFQQLKNEFHLNSSGVQGFISSRRGASQPLEHVEQDNVSLRKEISKLKSEQANFYEQLTSLKASYAESEQKLATSKQQYDNLLFNANNCVADKDQEIKLKVNEVDGLKASIQALESRNESLQESSKKLRGIILGKSKDKGEEIDDGTVTAEFVHLRDQIQRAIHKNYFFDPQVQLPNFKATKNTLINRFYGYWAADLTAEQLATRARAFVFDIINCDILNQPRFGLESRRFGKIEEHLKHFERALLQIAPNNANEIVEWRTRTMKCAALLDCDQPQGAKVANCIWRFMKPFLLSTETDSDRLGPWKEVCDEAVKFAVIVRSSKDEYKCEAPTYGTALLEAETNIQDQEMEVPGTAGDYDIVSFAIFGALVKYPEHSPNTRLVLEKAHVGTCQPRQHLLDRDHP